MKKYHQLILLIVSVISLSLFLIYRHEYNRLHYVLEVFNFFGQPCNFSELQKADFIVNQHDWGPQPVWQETDIGYIYSAFLTAKTEVRAIALQNDKENFPRNCFLWLEDKKKAVPGKFKFSKVSSDGNTAYFYICSAPNLNLESSPYAVSFNYKPGKETDLKKIPLTDTVTKELRKNVTVCVSPSVYTKKRFIEFLSFHKIIGIDSFIFYDGDIPHRLSKLITNLAQRLEVQVTFLPWNYPRRDSVLVRSLVENDCLLRTFGQTKFATTLETNEYLVPEVPLDSLFNNVGQSVSKVSLPVKKICINSLSPAKPIALQNFEAITDSGYNVVRYLFRNDYDGVVDENIVQGHAAIHKYVRCNTGHFKTSTDYTMNRFSTDLTRSTLVQLLLQGQL